MKNEVIVFTGPSGVGKRTLIEHVLKSVPNSRLSISATTRPPRAGEVHGQDYFFMTEREFGMKIDRGEFLEYAQYADNYYGTPKAQMEDTLSIGFTVLVEVEVIGAQQITARMPEAISVFIMPPEPHIETLRERLRARDTESEARIARRLEIAEEEMKIRGIFTHVIVNDNLLTAKAHVSAFVKRALRLTAV